MKSFILALTLAFSFASISANALDNSTIISILKTFRQQHEKATNIQWKAAEDFLIIEFKEEGKINYAYYNEYSERIVLAQPVALTDLNIQLQSSLAQLYPDHTIADVFILQDKKGTGYSAVAIKGSEKILLKSTGKKWSVLKKNIM
jgi:hypothetical protein